LASPPANWRGAATGASRSSFEGLIQIDPGAQRTHTYLQIHTLLLSPRAKLDAIPSVLVSADDVSASHGGTVGELDEMKIFYMQSRRLSPPPAVRVIVEGLFEPPAIVADGQARVVGCEDETDDGVGGGRQGLLGGVQPRWIREPRLDPPHQDDLQRLAAIVDGAGDEVAGREGAG